MSANASVFPLKEEVIGTSGLKTECITSPSRKNDYCKTQIAYQLTLYTGAEFGQLSLAMWGGTDKYSSPTGVCGLRFNGKNAKGKKSHIPHRLTFLTILQLGQSYPMGNLPREVYHALSDAMNG